MGQAEMDALGLIVTIVALWAIGACAFLAMGERLEGDDQNVAISTWTRWWSALICVGVIVYLIGRLQ